MPNIAYYKAREEELKKLNQILKTHSEGNQAAINATDETSFVKRVCDLIVENCGHPMVWIGYAENDAGKTVRPMAHAGFDEGYIDTLKLTWADDPRGQGPTGTAIRTGKPQKCADMQSDKRFLPWRNEAVKHGYRSSVSVPIMYQGAALGAITIYATEKDAFSGSEISLLSHMADDLAYDISIIRFRKEKEKMDEQRKLYDIERAKTEFIADATHELRTPLAIIKGSVDLALMEDGDGKTDHRSALLDIDHEITRLGEVLSDLALLTSKNTGYKRAIAKNEVMIRPLIERTVKRCATLAFEKRISIKTKYIPDVIVTGDEDHLERMILNIVKNALTYGKNKGHIVLDGKTDGRSVNIDISDDGAGISTDDLPRVFERFYRADKARTHSGTDNHTGLGLSIASWIAQAHDGSISAQSELGKGSVFTVSLPYIPASKAKY